MENTFEVKWQVSDGYAGGARPHYTKINAEDYDFFDGLKDEEIYAVIGEAVYNDFLATFEPSYDSDSVVEWAMSHRAKTKEHTADAGAKSG